MEKITLIGLLIVLSGAGCSTSKVTSSWKANDITSQKYNKIMVLGLTREADRTIQENMETHIVDDLKNLGYNAVSSLKEYGPKAFDKMDEEVAIDKLKNSGVDAVLTIVLLDKEKEKRYVPGDIYYSPYGYYQNRFWRYRALLYYRIYEPGYYVTDTRYFWESNLYKMDDQKLIYSVQTQSFSPANMETMAHEYGKMIVKNMVKENVLQQQGVTVAKPF
jgi:hypothetical protein